MLGQVADARLHAAADIDHQPVNGGGRCGGYHRVDDVVDVDEVARLGPLAMDDERSAAGRLAQEVRHDRRVGGGERLTRPIGVEHAQDDGLDVPQGADGADVVLGGELGDGVGGTGIRRGLLAERLVRLIAIRPRRRR